MSFISYKNGAFGNPDYIGHTLVKPKDPAIIESFWHPNEGIWFGAIPKDDLYLPTDKELVKVVENFYNNRLHKLDMIDPNLDHKPVIELKDFVKLIWLTGDFIRNGRFDTYYSAHYNPRKEINVMHPGGGRKFVTKFFCSKKTVQGFYFNTGGVQPRWLKHMHPYSILELKHKMNYVCEFVADHGSLIPHLYYYGTDAPLTTSKAVKAMNKDIIQRATGVKLHSNQKLPEYLIKQTNQKDYEYFLKFKKDYRYLDVIRGYICAVADVEYKDEHLQVIKRIR
jgi:hypothetical protein